MDEVSVFLGCDVVGHLVSDSPRQNAGLVVYPYEDQCVVPKRRGPNTQWRRTPDKSSVYLMEAIPLCDKIEVCVCVCVYIYIYTGCPRRNVKYFGRVFLMLNYTDITQNTYIQSWTVTEIMAREVWDFDSCYSLIDYQIHIETGRNMWFLYC